MPPSLYLLCILTSAHLQTLLSLPPPLPSNVCHCSPLACRLSSEVLGVDRTATLATLLYCFNPASVFCSAAYTESLFLALSFAGLWHLHHKPWLATALLALASSARSNGVLSAWFVLHNGLSKVSQRWSHQKVLRRSCCPNPLPASGATAFL